MCVVRIWRIGGQSVLTDTKADTTSASRSPFGTYYTRALQRPCVCVSFHVYHLFIFVSYEPSLHTYQLPPVVCVIFTALRTHMTIF